jgi:hypothetical protein
MAELRDKLDALNAEHERIERELRGFEDRDTRLRELEALPDLVEEYLRDLPTYSATRPRYASTRPSPRSVPKIIL